MQSKNTALPGACLVKPTFTCAGCGTRHLFTHFGGGLGNELMEPGEAAPICKACTDRAAASRKARRRIERAVRRQSRRPGGVPGRVVSLDPEWLSRWSDAE